MSRSKCESRKHIFRIHVVSSRRQDQKSRTYESTSSFSIMNSFLRTLMA